VVLRWYYHCKGQEKPGNQESPQNILRSFGEKIEQMMQRTQKKRCLLIIMHSGSKHASIKFVAKDE
jgi:hypothetical protein